MSFSEEFQDLFIEYLDQADAGEPGAIFIEKEPGTSILPVMNAFNIAERSGASTWSAYCGDRSQTLFEQLLPSNLKNILKMEKPPRIELALLADKKGMNIGTVKRDDSSLDPDIVCGMMAAVRNFIKDSLAIHTGGELADSDVERFEMHGYNILVYPGNIVNLTLILSGTIQERLLSEMKRVIGQIEMENGDVLAAWQGSMNDVEGIEEPIFSSFFASKQYEGNWDFQQLNLHRSKMYDDVLKIIESRSREGVLVFIAEDLELADPASLQLLAYVLRNLNSSKVLFLGTYSTSPHDEVSGSLEAVVNAMQSETSSKTMHQPSDINLNQMLDRISEENKENVSIVLHHGAILGTIDTDILQDSTGINHLALSDALEEMKGAGLIAGSGQQLNQSIANNVLSSMEMDDRKIISEIAAPVLENHRPEEVMSLAQLFGWLAMGNPEHKEKAKHYAAACAEYYTNIFNWDEAVEMWLAANEFSTDAEEKLGFLWNAMELEWILSRLDKIDDHASEMLELAQNNSSGKYCGLAYWMMGRVSNKKGDFDAAIAYLEKAERTMKSVDELGTLAWIFNTKGTMFTQNGKRDEAMNIFRQTLDLCKSQNNLALKAKAMTNMAYILMIQGKVDKSNETLQEAKNITENAGIIFARPAIFWHLALLAYNQEDFEKCAEYSKTALDTSYELGNWAVTIQCLTTLSAAYDKMGQNKLVEESTLEAYAMSKKTGAGDLLALTYNMFDLSFREQLKWLERTIEVTSKPNAHAETLKALKEEMIILLSNELDTMSKLIDSSINPEKKLTLAKQLKELLEQLDI
ncbi:MAG: tetratricopeptide repeat protein [Thermoplasmata archaeon]|nr:tetratricopeptide repeat protein [Thermoplasmata archaeon]